MRGMRARGHRCLEHLERYSGWSWPEEGTFEVLTHERRLPVKVFYLELKLDDQTLGKIPQAALRNFARGFSDRTRNLDNLTFICPSTVPILWRRDMLSTRQVLGATACSKAAQNS
jgi:hypothetical protein